MARLGLRFRLASVGYWDLNPYCGDPWSWGWPGCGYYDYPANYDIYNDDYNPYNNDDTYDVAPSSPAPVEDDAGADQNLPAQQ